MSSLAGAPLAESNPSTAATDLSRYIRLDTVDRQAAESLNKFFEAKATARSSGSRLANFAVVQTLITALPLVIADVGSLYLSVFFTSSVVERLMEVSTRQVENQTAFLISLIILPVAHLAGLYPGVGCNPIVEFRQIARSLFVSFSVLAGIGLFCFPENWIFYCVSSVFAFGLALPSAVCARFLARHVAKRFAWWGVPTFILAEPQRALEIYRRLQRKPEQGFRPAGVLLDSGHYGSGEDCLHAAQVPAYDLRFTDQAAREKLVTFVIVARSNDRPALPNLEPLLASIPNRVVLSADHADLGIWDQMYSIGSNSGMCLAGVRHNSVKLLLKRVVDLSISLGVLFLGFPVLALICLLIRLTSKGPIFYGQRRVGRDGREFTAWKWRTMCVDAEEVLEEYLEKHPAARVEWEETHKLARDPRVTSVGRFLRKTSLDELPQLWNVIVGEMSLVGPRPIIDSPRYDECYITDYPAEFEAYKTVRPGLTGMWQVGCRNRGVYEMRIFYDMYYIRNWCIWLDLYLIMRTFKTVVSGEGR